MAARFGHTRKYLAKSKQSQRRTSTILDTPSQPICPNHRGSWARSSSRRKHSHTHTHTHTRTRPNERMNPVGRGKSAWVFRLYSSWVGYLLTLRGARKSRKVFSAASCLIRDEVFWTGKGAPFCVSRTDGQVLSSRIRDLFTRKEFTEDDIVPHLILPLRVIEYGMRSSRLL